MATTYTLQAPLSLLDLAAGMKLVLECVHPTTGAAVTGVKATAWAVYGTDISASLGTVEDIIPRWSDEETVLA